MKYFILFLFFISSAFAGLTAPKYFEILDNPQAAKDKIEYLSACQPGGSFFIPASTMSMWPTLDQGCYVLVARKPWNQVAVGDILGYSHKGTGGVDPLFAALHRAIGKSKYGFIMKGDNNKYADAPFVTDDDYQYVVFAIVRFKKIPFGIPKPLWAVKK